MPAAVLPRREFRGSCGRGSRGKGTRHVNLAPLSCRRPRPPVSARKAGMLSSLLAEIPAPALYEAWMRLAIREAKIAEAAGEVPVGAVIVSPAGEVLGCGNNQVLRTNDPTAHAEIVALRQAGAALANYRLLDCTLLCTLEPCAMCAGALLHARVKRLVYAACDPKAGACGSVLQVMNHPALNHRVEMLGGVLEAECSAMLRDFFRRRRAQQAAERGQHPDAETA